MEINFKNKKIVSQKISDTENAWRIEDAFFVLEYLKNKNKIVLGGDILTKNLEHNYDSWYYNVKLNKNYNINVECSIKLAFEYISKYIQTNGNTFYVVFVIK